MPLGLTIECVGEVQVQRVFERFGERAVATQELWPQMIRDLQKIEELQFASQGSHGAGGWAPLQPETLAEKARKGQPSDILQATRALFKSLTGESEHSIIESFGHTLRFGTSVPYAAHHQFGAPGANLPMRKVMQLTFAERRALAKQVQAFIVTGEVRSMA